MIIFSDFDDTFDDRNNPGVRRKNILAVREWRRAGNQFVIISGRNFMVFNKIFPDWKDVVDYLILDNGGTVMLPDENIFHGQFLAPILDQLQPESQDTLLVYYYPRYFSTELSDTAEIVTLRVWFKDLPSLWRQKEIYDQSGLPIQAIPWPKPGYSNMLKGVDLTQYAGFINVVPNPGGKERAVAYLLEYLGVDHDEIVAIGDHYSDVQMLQTYNGYAVAGAIPEAIDAAQGRTISSVAELIDVLLKERAK